MPGQERKKNGWIVVTTIHSPNTTIEYISKLCHEGWSAVIVGDVKTPADWPVLIQNVHFISVDRQKEIFGKYADMIPYGHYGRKNLGYLYALLQGADFILETDDDNIPFSSFGENISRFVTGRLVGGQGWINIYKYFTETHIWPRGLPLDEIYSTGQIIAEEAQSECPIQQFLADNDPDVDAIYRLIFRKPTFFDRSALPVILSDNSWAPFNSQNTLFFSEAFPLLYLPCHVSFRMTDIWRSFVAQITLWAHGYKLAFHTSTVEQIRNPHDLMQDFGQEIIGYTDNKRILTLLNAARANLRNTDRKNLTHTAYAFWMSLIDGGIIPRKELAIIDGWFEMVEKFSGKSRKAASEYN